MKKLNSTAAGIISSFMIIFVPALIQIIGMFSTNPNADYAVVTFTSVNIQALVGFVYAVFKALSKNKKEYTLCFAASMAVVGIGWGHIAITYLTGDYVSAAIPLYYTALSLPGVIVYELIAFLLKAILKNKAENHEKTRMIRSVAYILIISLAINLIFWIPENWLRLIGMSGFSILGMALVDTVVNSRKKWIPIVVFVCVNAVLIPLNIWLLNTNGIIN